MKAAVIHGPGKVTCDNVDDPIIQNDRDIILEEGKIMNIDPLIIGIVAGILTAVSLLPQLIKIIREKKAEDISYFMLIILLLGLCTWIWYGITKEDWPIIITNSFSLLINVLVIIFTIKYKKD